MDKKDCKFRGFGNREVAYCHYEHPYPNISKECDEKKCPLESYIIDVDEDCNITYSDGSVKPCPYRPSMTFQDCDPGYGSHGLCEKWNYYHKIGVYILR